MPQSFYNAQPDRSGCGCGFSFNSKDRAVYVSFVQQSGWNANSKSGSFAGPKLNLKLTISEAGHMIWAIARLEQWKAFHDTSKGNYVDKYTTQISFMPFGPKDSNGVILPATLRFGLSVRKKEKETNVETKWSIALSKGDVIVIQNCLEFALEHIFSSDYAEDKKKRLEAAKLREQNSSIQSLDESAF